MSLPNIEKHVKILEDEIKKAKAYFKRTKDNNVTIDKKTYLHLLEWKLTTLKQIVKEKRIKR